jgi:hypothetical protein
VIQEPVDFWTRGTFMEQNGTTVAGGAAGYGTFTDEPVVHEGSRAVHVRGQMAIGLAGHHGWLRL